MPNLEGLPPFPERKNCFRQVRGGDTRDYEIHRQTGMIQNHDYSSQHFTLDVPRTPARAGYNLGLVNLFSRKASLALFWRHHSRRSERFPPLYCNAKSTRFTASPGGKKAFRRVRGAGTHATSLI
jgi:hypothetical protein